LTRRLFGSHIYASPCRLYVCSGNRGLLVYMQLFGFPNLTGPGVGNSPAVLFQPKRFALLAYLVVARPRGYHSRDHLLGLLWPNSDLDHARNSLRQSLHFLRRCLGPEALVNRGETGLSLAPELLHCDVVEFESALESGDVEMAMGFYKADLLEGFFIPAAGPFEQWLEKERAHLRALAVAAAGRLCEQAIEAGKDMAAIRWARRAVDVDPADEPSIRSLIEALARLGNRAAAARVYHEFAERLRFEYELEPSPETTAAFDAMRKWVAPWRTGRRGQPRLLPSLGAATDHPTSTPRPAPKSA